MLGKLFFTLAFMVRHRILYLRYRQTVAVDSRDEKTVNADAWLDYLSLHASSPYPGNSACVPHEGESRATGLSTYLCPWPLASGAEPSVLSQVPCFCVFIPLRTTPNCTDSSFFSCRFQSQQLEFVP